MSHFLLRIADNNEWIKFCSQPHHVKLVRDGRNWIESRIVFLQFAVKTVQTLQNRKFELETFPNSWFENKHDEDDHCIHCHAKEVDNDPKRRQTLYL